MGAGPPGLVMDDVGATVNDTGGRENDSNSSSLRTEETTICYVQERSSCSRDRPSGATDSLVQQRRKIEAPRNQRNSVGAADGLNRQWSCSVCVVQ